MKIKNEGRQFFPSEVQPGKAVTIVVPGLNMKNAAFSDIINTLNQDGIDVILVNLTGQRNDPSILATITRQAWISHLLEAHDFARTLIKDNPRPVYFIGFSVGALVNLEVLSRYPGVVHYDKMVLLAPANALRGRAYLIKIFFLLGRKSGIPSLQPKDYRIHNKTPVQAYRVLFEMKKSIENQNYHHLNIPTLVVIDPKDELISPGNLRKIINKYRLTNWQVFTLDSQHVGRTTGYHHLVADENSMGTENWNPFISRLKVFFLIPVS